MLQLQDELIHTKIQNVLDVKHLYRAVKDMKAKDKSKPKLKEQERHGLALKMKLASPPKAGRQVGRRGVVSRVNSPIAGPLHAINPVLVKQKDLFQVFKVDPERRKAQLLAKAGAYTPSMDYDSEELPSELGSITAS